MQAATVEKGIWVLIYGGIALVSVGVFVGRTDDTLSLALEVAGAVCLVAGVLLIWLRSRMKTPSDK